MKKRINPLSTIILLIFILLCIEACSDHTNPSFTEFVELGNEGLTPGYEYVFQNFDQSVLEKKINRDSLFGVDLLIRYNDQCRISELPLEIEYYSILQDSVISIHESISLFGNNDTQSFSNHFGLFEIRIPIIEKIIKSNVFFISLKTFEEDTQGIIALGISLVNIE